VGLISQSDSILGFNRSESNEQEMRSRTLPELLWYPVLGFHEGVHKCSGASFVSNDVGVMFQSFIQHSDDGYFDVILVAAAIAIVTSHVSQTLERRHDTLIVPLTKSSSATSKDSKLKQ
jgi:hypothetical protein